jgi:hypothetical protein
MIYFNLIQLINSSSIIDFTVEVFPYFILRFAGYLICV